MQGRKMAKDKAAMVLAPRLAVQSARRTKICSAHVVFAATGDVKMEKYATTAPTRIAELVMPLAQPLVRVQPAAMV